MSNLKKLLAIIFISNIYSCNILTTNTNSNLNKENFDKPKQPSIIKETNKYIVDFGKKATKSNANFTFKVNIKRNSFNIKCTPGPLGNCTPIDVKSMKVWLIEYDDAGGYPVPAATVLNPVAATSFVFDLTTNPTASITYQNVPSNNTGKSYVIAATPFDALAGGGTNITNTTTSNSVIVNDGGFNFAYVSNFGGDPLNLGSVKVNGSHVVSSTNDLQISMKVSP